MAVLVENQHDRFQTGTTINGDGGSLYQTGIIDVPYYMGFFFIKMFDNAQRADQSTNKVAYIKLMREWHQEKYGCSLGLKDAKDIVDHYSNISAQPTYERRIPYKQG